MLTYDLTCICKACSSSHSVSPRSSIFVECCPDNYIPDALFLTWPCGDQSNQFGPCDGPDIHFCDDWHGVFGGLMTYHLITIYDGFNNVTTLGYEYDDADLNVKFACLSVWVSNVLIKHHGCNAFAGAFGVLFSCQPFFWETSTHDYFCANGQELLCPNKFFISE